MGNDGMLPTFGISSKLAYGLIVQSILVIIAALISIWGIFEAYHGFTLNYITNIISLLVCISLLVYSFYGFNAKRNQEAFFLSTIILYIILIIFGLFASSVDFKNPVSILTIITLISTIFFLREYSRSYKVANFAMLIVIISGLSY
jgi:hypothetical protein